MTISFMKPTVIVEGNVLRVTSKFSANEDVTFTSLGVFYRLASSTSPGDNKTFGSHSGTSVVAGGGIYTGSFEDLSPAVPDGTYDVWTSRRINGSSTYIQTDKVRVTVNTAVVGNPPTLAVSVQDGDGSLTVAWEPSDASAFASYQARIVSPTSAAKETVLLGSSIRSAVFDGLENYVDHSIEVDGNLA